MIRSAVRTSFVLAGVFLLAPLVAVARRDPNSPILHPTASDVRAAKSLLLNRAILGSRFQASPSGTSPNSNSGSCAGFDPNLRALTETAEVYGDLLTDRSDGLLFTSEAEVYVSSAQAATAQALETAPGAGRCVASAAKQAAGTNAVVLKKKVTPISFAVGGLRAKAWDAQLLVRANAVVTTSAISDREAASLFCRIPSWIFRPIERSSSMTPIYTCKNERTDCSAPIVFATQFWSPVYDLARCPR